MANRFEHLLILLPWLYAHNGVSVEDARAEFGRTEKEFYDDLTLLTLVGVGQYATEQFEIDWHDGNIYVHDNLGLDRAFVAVVPVELEQLFVQVPEFAGCMVPYSS